MDRKAEVREAEIRDAITAALHSIDGDRSPLDLVEEIPIIEAATNELVANRVAQARSQGLSWEAIAQRLGTTRQAAHKRFGKRKAKKSRSGRIEIRLERSKPKR